MVCFYVFGKCELTPATFCEQSLQFVLFTVLNTYNYHSNKLYIPLITVMYISTVRITNNSANSVIDIIITIFVTPKGRMIISLSKTISQFCNYYDHCKQLDTCYVINRITITCCNTMYYSSMINKVSKSVIS